MNRKDRLARWIAERLPRKVCVFVFYRMVGLYTSMEKITALDIINRWEKGWPNA